MRVRLWARGLFGFYKSIGLENTGLFDAAVCAVPNTTTIELIILEFANIFFSPELITSPKIVRSLTGQGALLEFTHVLVTFDLVST